MKLLLLLLLNILAISYIIDILKKKKVMEDTDEVIDHAND